MNWYLKGFRQYADFRGRARRSEYWYFTLFNLLAIASLAVLDRIVSHLTGTQISILGGLYTLAALVPSLAVTVRRLHDTDRSGWWVLLAAVPLAGLVIIVFLVQDGMDSSNRHGKNPKMIFA